MMVLMLTSTLVPPHLHGPPTFELQPPLATFEPNFPSLVDPFFVWPSKHEYHHLGILPEHRSDQGEIEPNGVGLEKPSCKMKGRLGPDMEEIMRKEVFKPTSIGALYSRWIDSFEFSQVPQHDPIHPG